MERNSIFGFNQIGLRD